MLKYQQSDRGLNFICETMDLHCSLFLLWLILNLNCLFHGFLLDHNNENLETIPSHLSQDISELDLHENCISVIPDDAFQGLTALKYLSLFQNKIQKVSHLAFKGLPLEEIYIGGNLLTTISPFTILGSTLRILGIRYNQITFIPKMTIAKLKKLVELLLTGNPLLQIPDFSEVSDEQLTVFNLEIFDLKVECCSLAATLKLMNHQNLSQSLCSNSDLASMSWSNITTEQLDNIRCIGE